MPLDPSVLDLPALAALAGAAANDFIAEQLHAQGYRGVRISHGYVIQNLIDTTPTIGELATRLGVTQQAASKTVNDLERLGLVERRIDSGDSRVRRVALTRRGQACLDVARTVRRDLDAAVAADVGEADQDAAKRALVALLTHTGGFEAVRRRQAKLPTD